MAAAVLAVVAPVAAVGRLVAVDQVAGRLAVVHRVAAVGAVVRRIAQRWRAYGDRWASRRSIKQRRARRRAAGWRWAAGWRRATGWRHARAWPCPVVGQAGRGWPRQCVRQYAPKGRLKLPTVMDRTRILRGHQRLGASDILKALLKLGVLANINQQIRL